MYAAAAGIAGTGFQIADIDDVWPRIVERARRCRSDQVVLDNACARCHPEGDAVCLQGPDGVVIMSAHGHAPGFVVADVLLAVSNCRAGAFRRQEQAMVAIAQDLGASTLSFRTDRRGWARMLGPAWREQNGTFSRTIPTPHDAHHCDNERST